MKRTIRQRALIGTLCAALGVFLVAVCDRNATEPTPRDAPHAKSDKGPLHRQLVNSRSHAIELKQLQALGYVNGTYDPEHEKANVLVRIEGKTDDGYNFYSSRQSRGAKLIDMDGRTIHQWRAPQKGAWQHAELLPNGDVIVIVKDERLSRYDQDSNLVWSIEGQFHHDLWIDGKRIYVLARVPKIVDYIHPRSPTLVDLIQVRSLDGELLDEFSVLDTIHESPYRFLLPSLSRESTIKKGRVLDVLHTNHVEVFDGSLGHRHPIYGKGNILISMRNINTIAILDAESRKVLWVWGPSNLTFQHDPTLLQNGHILLFDNGQARSRVIEIAPLSGQLLWAYAPSSGFFSETRGSNQRLSNGNTLITESDRGYVIEVTPSGKIVWKFANPVVNRKKEREAIWRMTRVKPDSLTFLDR